MGKIMTTKVDNKKWITLREFEMILLEEFGCIPVGVTCYNEFMSWYELRESLFPELTREKLKEIADKIPQHYTVLDTYGTIEDRYWKLRIYGLQ